MVVQMLSAFEKKNHFYCRRSYRVEYIQIGHFRMMKRNMTIQTCGMKLELSKRVPVG